VLLRIAAAYDNGASGIRSAALAGSVKRRRFDDARRRVRLRYEHAAVVIFGPAAEHHDDGARSELDARRIGCAALSPIEKRRREPAGRKQPQQDGGGYGNGKAHTATQCKDCEKKSE
jgi:hypothetical protein